MLRSRLIAISIPDQKKRHAIAFRPYPELVEAPDKGHYSPDSRRRKIAQYLEQRDVASAEELSRHLVEIALRASNYFQK